MLKKNEECLVTNLSLLVVTKFVLQQKKRKHWKTLVVSHTEIHKRIKEAGVRVLYTLHKRKLYLPGLIQPIQAVGALLAAVALQHRQEVLRRWAVLLSQLWKPNQQTSQFTFMLPKPQQSYSTFLVYTVMRHREA